MSFLVSFSSVNCCIIPLAGTAALSPLSNFWRSGWKFSSGCFQALTQMILQNSSLFIFLDILLILRSWVDLSFACGVLHSWSLLAEEGDGCYEACWAPPSLSSTKPVTKMAFLCVGGIFFNADLGDSTLKCSAYEYSKSLV